MITRKVAIGSSGSETPRRMNARRKYSMASWWPLAITLSPSFRLSKDRTSSKVPTRVAPSCGCFNPWHLWQERSFTLILTKSLLVMKTWMSWSLESATQAAMRLWNCLWWPKIATCPRGEEFGCFGESGQMANPSIHFTSGGTWIIWID